MSSVLVAGVRHAWERVAILGIVCCNFGGKKSDSASIHYTTTAYTRTYANTAMYYIIKSRIESGVWIICMSPYGTRSNFSAADSFESLRCSLPCWCLCLPYIPLLFHRGVKGAPLRVVSLALLTWNCDKSNPSRHSPARGVIRTLKPHKAETSEACQALANNACVWISLSLAWLNPFVRLVLVLTVQQEIKLTLQICGADRKRHPARNPHCYFISCQFVTCRIPGWGMTWKVWQAKRE